MVWLRSGDNNNPYNVNYLTSSGGNNWGYAATLAVRPALHSFAMQKKVADFPEFKADSALNSNR